jgi:drug/metabolite transporter (DMT)-like permease
MWLAPTLDAGVQHADVLLSVRRATARGTRAVVITGLRPPKSRTPAVQTWLTVSACGVTVLLWASAFVAIRKAGEQLSPGALSLGRLAIASAVLGLLVLVRRERVHLTGGDWLRIIIFGAAWFGIYNLALNDAERHVDAGIAAMVVNIGPILIALLAGWLLKEGFARGLLGGSVLAFGGVAVIAFSASTGTHADLLGVVLCVVAAVAYSIGVVNQKPLLGHLPGLTVTWLGCTVGMLVCLPFAPSLVHDVGHAGGGSLVLVAYLAVFPTAVGFTTWAYALRRTTAGKMGATTYLVPTVAIFLGWLLLGEQPAPLALVGGALCLAGVFLTRRRPRRTRVMAATASLTDHGPTAA